MDDSCAVCADNLEYVAYGSCGHKEVCSTCIIRLRFVLGDTQCCICKSESHIIFITKALGDYTRQINDFTTTFFPLSPKEGQVGAFWYHEDTKAFFDDLDQYKMVKSMCRLSCSVCYKGEDHLKSVEQLQDHLYDTHKLYMCGLCLKGRKVFICEQKLYTSAQLKQHIDTGDFEVDGNENERGGFKGHPMCEFCRKPFYDDNELFTHMSTEHYTCHFCQRLKPGQYEYYKNYDDLEIHFRRNHFLCEYDSCLAEKFIVFQNESELKRHNVIEHGGKLSRSRRNAALQIPTSFRYRYGNDLENHSTRDRSFHQEPSHLPSSESHVGISGGSCLGESSFPPLSGQQRSRQNIQTLSTNTMAARLRFLTNQTNTASAVVSRSQGWPVVNLSQAQASVTSCNKYSPVQASTSSAQSKFFAKVPQPKPLVSSTVPQVGQRSSNTQRPSDVKSANKSLIERIRSSFGHDEDVFMAFKYISGQYRQGLIDARTYLDYTKSYGLYHLVIDLATLCPDPKRQKELTDAHYASLRGESLTESAHGAEQSSSQPKQSQSSKKNKGKGKTVT